MTKFGWTTLVILPIAVLSMLGYVSYHYFIQEGDEQEQIETNRKSVVTMMPVATSTAYAVASGEYPQFSGVSNAFNLKIKSVVDKAIQDQFIGAKENREARIATSGEGLDLPPVSEDEEKYPISFRTVVVRNDARGISVVMYIDQFTGGAHGMQSMATFNYDAERQKEITIDTLIQSDARFLEKISAQSRAFLLKDLAQRGGVTAEEIDKEMLDDGTAPRVENFSLFTLASDAQITFYFTPYQVAAYVFGSSEMKTRLPLE